MKKSYNFRFLFNFNMSASSNGGQAADKLVSQEDIRLVPIILRRRPGLIELAYRDCRNRSVCGGSSNVVGFNTLR